MRLFKLFSLMALFFLLSEHSNAEPVSDQLVGSIIVTKNSSIDAKARKELASIAHKIKKMRNSGSIRLVGTVPAATSQDDYIIKSVFIARNVETLLRKLLPQSFQIYVTTAKHEELKSGERTGVSVYLYPYELRPEGAKFISTDIDHAQSLSAPDNAQKTIERTLPDKASLPSQGGSLSQPQYDDDSQNYKNTKNRIQVETEDAAKAEELVNKAKARAAKRAKQLETE